MTHYHDNDYENIYYNVEDIKSELGLPTHKRTGHFERTLDKLNENNGLIFDWIMADRREYRMLVPSGAVKLLWEFKRTLPKKIRPRYEKCADDMIFSVLSDWFWDEYDPYYVTFNEMTEKLNRFRRWKLSEDLRPIYDEYAERLLNSLSLLITDWDKYK